MPVLGQPVDGICRCEPPQVVCINGPPTPDGMMQVQLRGAFPPISSDRWCGKHSDRMPTSGLAS